MDAADIDKHDCPPLIVDGDCASAQVSFDNEPRHIQHDYRT